MRQLTYWNRLNSSHLVFLQAREILEWQHHSLAAEICFDIPADWDFASDSESPWKFEKRKCYLPNQLSFFGGRYVLTDLRWSLVSRVKILLPKIIADMIQCTSINYRQNQKINRCYFFCDSLSQLRLNMHLLCMRLAAEGADDSSEMLSVIVGCPKTFCVSRQKFMKNTQVPPSHNSSS